MKHPTKLGAAFFASVSIILFFIITPVMATDTGEIRIGYTAPLTGAAAEFGNNGWCGIQLALKEINKKGISIGGKFHKIRIFQYDSGCAPDEGVSNVYKMITEDKVVAILGDHCSTVCNVIAPLCDQYQVPGITIECGADNVTNPGHEFYFRMRPTIKMMIPSVMPKIFKTFDVRTAAFLVVDDEYGKNHIEAIKNELEWRDVKIVAQETFERESNEYLPQLERIHSTKPDLLFYVGTALEGATILQQARKLGMMPRTKFIGSEEMGEIELLLRAGRDAVEETYAISLWGKSPPEFTQLVKRSCDRPMHQAIIFGYDAMHVLAKAIESAQSLEPIKIKEGLKKTDYKSLAGYIRFKNFNGYKNQSKFVPSMIRWKNGKRVHLDIFLKWEE